MARRKTQATEVTVATDPEVSATPQSETLWLPAPKPYEVAIILPTTGRPAQAYACIQNIFATTRPYKVQVVAVVDADPTTAALLAKLPDVKVWTRPTKLGPVDAWNTGAMLADADWFVLAADDEWFGADWLAAAFAQVDAQHDFIGFNDGLYPPPSPYPVFATAWLVSRQHLIEVQGGVMTIPLYKAWALDVEMSQQAIKAGRYAYAEAAHWKHYQVAAGLAEPDATSEATKIWHDQDVTLYFARAKEGFPQTWEPVLTEAGPNGVPVGEQHRPEAKLPDLAVITCTWQRPERLRRTLAMLKAQTKQDFDLFLINNNPDLHAMVDAACNRYGPVHLTHNATNTGSGAKVMQAHACALAGYAYIVLIDDDFDFSASFLAQMWAARRPDALVSFRVQRVKPGGTYWQRDPVEEDGGVGTYVEGTGTIIPAGAVRAPAILALPSANSPADNVWLSYYAWQAGYLCVKSTITGCQEVLDGKNTYVNHIDMKVRFFQQLREQGWAV
jgi:GT2 family glycosyltransferase